MMLANVTLRRMVLAVVYLGALVWGGVRVHDALNYHQLIDLPYFDLAGVIVLSLACWHAIEYL